MTSSTMSSESAPRSSTNDAVLSTWFSSTPSCSTIICFTFCSTAMLPPEWGYKLIDSSDLAPGSASQSPDILCFCKPMLDSPPQAGESFAVLLEETQQGNRFAQNVLYGMTFRRLRSI